jgi:hypothetical protein
MTKQNMPERLIRKKRIKEIYPNGLTFVDYDFSKIELADWWNDLLNCVDVIKVDCDKCWSQLLYDYFNHFKLSIFRKVLDSFDDIDHPYSGQDILRFVPQTDAFWKFITKKLMKKGDIMQSQVWQFGPKLGLRKIYVEQQKRIESYSPDDLLEQINEFANLALAIPMSNWEQNENFGLKIISNCRNYQRLLILGYLMPPTWYLKSKLNENSWLRILQMAGVIDEGGVRGTYGTRVLAKDGHECNSIAEVEIDNWLSENDIPHEKEPFYPYDEELNPNTRYRGDFKIGETIVEYAGLMTKSEYREKMKTKEKLAEKLELSLIILTAKDLHRLDNMFKDLHNV